MVRGEKKKLRYLSKITHCYSHVNCVCEQKLYSSARVIRNVCVLFSHIGITNIMLLRSYNDSFNPKSELKR